MERRSSSRVSRRIEVRFWRRGESQPHVGFTSNVSESGLFLGTAHPLKPGDRIRMELVDAERGFLVEGRIARVHRVALALRHVEQPGVGVLFLLPKELMGELVPGVLSTNGGRRPAPTTPGGAPRGSTANGGGTSTAGPPGGEGTSGLEVFPVEFHDASTFLSVFHRDIASGGLFLSTDSPAELQRVVVVELRPPEPAVGRLRFKARVVHRIGPTAAVGGGRNLLAGMGVQFLEPERVLAELQPILAALRR